MFKTKNDDTTTIQRLVALFGLEDMNFKNRTDWKVVELPHPSTGDVINFGIITTTTQEQHIYEVQSIGTKYGSYFIGSLVLKNGDLYVATRVDPLWFILESLSSSLSGNKSRWQPYDQLKITEELQGIFSSLKSSRSQLENLCCVNTKLGEERDMLLYKLDEKRVLQWLIRKQKRSYNALLAEFMNDKDRSSKTSSRSHGFNLLEDDTIIKPTTPNKNQMTQQQPDLTSLEQNRIQEHSIQVVCEYLSPSWRKKFLQHLGEDEGKFLHLGKKKVDDIYSRHSLEYEMTELNGIQSARKKPKLTPQSAGQKRLQKVSTKGMKAMSSFFEAKSKK